jgi:hypothetical protein
VATPEQKAFCVLQVAKHEPVVSLQRAFRRQFQNDPPSADSIRRWHQQFQTTVMGKVQDIHVCQECGTSETVFSSQSEEICALCESRIGDVDYDRVEGVAKETGNEALSSSHGAVSSSILLHDVLHNQSKQ